jgi:hypothetical protein
MVPLWCHWAPKKMLDSGLGLSAARSPISVTARLALSTRSFSLRLVESSLAPWLASFLSMRIWQLLPCEHTMTSVCHGGVAAWRMEAYVSWMDWGLGWACVWVLRSWCSAISIVAVVRFLARSDMATVKVSVIPQVSLQSSSTKSTFDVMANWSVVSTSVVDLVRFSMIGLSSSWMHSAMVNTVVMLAWSSRTSVNAQIISVAVLGILDVELMRRRRP